MEILRGIALANGFRNSRDKWYENKAFTALFSFKKLSFGSIKVSCFKTLKIKVTNKHLQT